MPKASTGLELFADHIDGRLHVAIVKKGALNNLYVDPLDMSGCWSSLYLGKVAKIDKGLDAAFIDLGDGTMGFLPAKHIYKRGSNKSERRTGISQLIKEGQPLIVQIKSEAKRNSEHEHHKLPRLTTKVYTFGQHLIYSPVSSRVAVSHRVSNEEILRAATELKGTGGWLVQSTAEQATVKDIELEAQNLLQDWASIESRRKELGPSPGLIRHGQSALDRTFSKFGIAAFEHIYVGNRDLLGYVMDWSQRIYPPLANSKRLRLFRPEKESERLFETYDIYSELEKLDDARIELKGGGSIIIETTQALTVIDVNRGNAKSVIELNKAAAHEIARQIRLRSLSGAILVDFINLRKRSERADLIETLENEFMSDMTQVDVHGFTRLGIVEITRKRRSTSLAEARVT